MTTVFLRFAPLTLFAGFVACSTPKETSPGSVPEIELGRPVPAALVRRAPSDDFKRAYALCAEADVAFDAGDIERAKLLVREALVTLEPEHDSNLTWERVLLLADLHGFQVTHDPSRRAVSGTRRSDAESRMFAIGGLYSDLHRLRGVGADRRPALAEGEAERVEPEVDEDRTAWDSTSLPPPLDFETDDVSPERYGLTVEDMDGLSVPAVGGEPEDHALTTPDPEILADAGVDAGLTAALDADVDGDDRLAADRYERAIARRPIFGVANVQISIAIRISIAMELSRSGATAEGASLLVGLLADLERTGRGESPEASATRARLADALDATGDHAAAAEHRRDGSHSKQGGARSGGPGWFRLGSLVAADREDDARDCGRGLLEGALADSTEDLDAPGGSKSRRGVAETGLALGLFDFAAYAYSSWNDDEDGPLSDVDKQRCADAVAGAGDHPRAITLAEALLAAHQNELSDLKSAALRRVAASSMAEGDLRRAREAAEAQFELEKKRFTKDHPRVQTARALLSDVAFAQGRLAEAEALQRENYESLCATLPAGHPVLVRVRNAWVATLQELGRFHEALELLPDPVAASPMEASAERDVEALVREAARYQSECRLEEALDLRRRAVELQREALSPRDPQRMEGLLELAALLRVLGSTAEARDVELALETLRTGAPDDASRLVERLAASRDTSPPTEPLVRVHCRVVDPGPDGGPPRMTAEVEDPAGILALHVFQDGTARLVDRDRGGLELSEDGRHARLELPVEVQPGQLLSIVSIAVENVWGERSAYETAVAWSPQTR